LTDCERAVGDAIVNKYLDWHAIEGFATGQVGFVKRGRTALTSIFSNSMPSADLAAYRLHDKSKGKGCLSHRKRCVGGTFARI
jgi:hypothetical protein